MYNKNHTALLNCPLGKTGVVTIHNGVSIIGDNAFSNCTKLTGVTIPDIRKTARFT
ncbi:hypothetical protein [Treponema sp. R80B11-R83G3]